MNIKIKKMMKKRIDPLFSKQKNDGSQTMSEPSTNSDISNNPYLQSKKLWSDIYGNAEERYRKSRLYNLFLLSLILISVCGIIYIGSQSKFIPYVVEVQNGQVIYTGVATQSNFNSVKSQIAHFFIQQFVESARSISIDGAIEKNNQKRAFALTQSAATSELNDFYKQQDPYSVVKQRTISIQINYVNQLPNNDFQVGWTENSRDSQTGETLSKEQYIGEFDFKWDKPSQDEFILHNNPFGFYITNISWTGVK